MKLHLNKSSLAILEAAQANGDDFLGLIEKAFDLAEILPDVPVPPMQRRDTTGRPVWHCTKCNWHVGAETVADALESLNSKAFVTRCRHTMAPVLDLPEEPELPSLAEAAKLAREAWLTSDGWGPSRSEEELKYLRLAWEAGRAWQAERNAKAV